MISIFHKSILVFSFCALGAFSAFAQTPKVQFIHNCVEDSLSTIDVWVNGQVWANDLNLHQATSLQSAADSGSWSIRHSDDSSIVYYSWSAQLAVNSKHIFTIQGNLDPLNHSPFIPLEVHQFEGALEQSSSTSSIDVNFLHGTSDLDSIEIAETQLFQLTAFNDLSHGSYSGYLPLFTADYGWSVIREADSSLVAEFALPVNALNWAGKAITIVTSGYTNQRQNNAGESFGLWAITSAGGDMVKLEPLRWNINSEVQFVHNASLPNSASIEINCDGILWQENILTHDATAFTPFPSGKEVELCINSVLSNGLIDTIWCDTLQLLSGQNYQLICYGDETPSLTPQLYIRSWSPGNPISFDSIEISFFNGSASWPLLSIHDSDAMGLPIIENVSFANLSNSVVLPNEETEWDLSSQGDSLVRLRAPFGSTFYSQQRITLLSFADTSLNIPSLWLCHPEGGPMIRLETVTPPEVPDFCQIQFVHTSADTLLSAVDIWLNDSLWFPAFEFETATSFVTVSCNDAIWLRVTPSGDSLTTYLESALSLEANELHRLFLWGIFNTGQYNPAPPLAWKIESGISLTADNNNEFNLRFFHAATDLGAVDLNETSLPVAALFTNITSGNLSQEATLPAGDDLVFSLRNSPTQFMFGSYSLPVVALGLPGSAATIISTGFRQPANNSNGPSLKMWVLLPGGEMIELLPHVGIEHESNRTKPFTLFPNPCHSFIQLTGEMESEQSISVQLFDGIGKRIESHQMQELLSSSSRFFSTSPLSDGTYFLVISNGVETFTLPFIKDGN